MVADPVAKALALQQRMLAGRREAMEREEGECMTDNAGGSVDTAFVQEVLPLEPSIEPQPRRVLPRARRASSRMLASERHPQRDFFAADFVDVPQKNDRHTMEHPIFSLRKQPDTAIREYQHNDVRITITPSVLGMATIWDKDLLIYATSQLVQGVNEGRTDAFNRTIRFTAYDYFLSTNRGTSGADYDALEKTLERLKGTQIKTNIATGGERRKRGFGLIEDWEIVEREEGGRMMAIEVTLSKWLYNAVQALEVLTINKEYFRLKGGLEKRLYELARKHCGNQATWTVGEEVLHKKSGSTANIREFRRLVKDIVSADSLPDYRMVYDHKARKCIFYTRNIRKLNPEAIATLAGRKENSPELHFQHEAIHAFQSPKST